MNKKTSKTGKFSEFFYDPSIEYYHINQTIGKDIFPIDVGHAISKKEEPAVKTSYPYYLLNYITQGSIMFKVDSQKTCLSAGNIYLIPPNKITSRKTNTDEELEFYWINFNGIECEKIIKNTKFANCYCFVPKNKKIIKKAFEKAISAKNEGFSQGYTVLSALLEIFSNLIKENSKNQNAIGIHDNSRFAVILDYINSNMFNKDLNCEDICSKMFISKNYFSKMFKINMGTTFVKYITYERIKKATELLTTTNLYIKEISSMVGFSDALYFSKIFTKLRLVCPETYRNEKSVLFNETVNK